MDMDTAMDTAEPQAQPVPVQPTIQLSETPFTNAIVPGIPFLLP